MTYIVILSAHGSTVNLNHMRADNFMHVFAVLEMLLAHLAPPHRRIVGGFTKIEKGILAGGICLRFDRHRTGVLNTPYYVVHAMQMALQIAGALIRQVLEADPTPNRILREPSNVLPYHTATDAAPAWR